MDYALNRIALNPYSNFITNRSSRISLMFIDLFDDGLLKILFITIYLNPCSSPLD